MTILPICLNCRHLDVGQQPMRCRAFPDGIPAPILLMKADHHDPYPGDGGIRFEPVLSAPLRRVAGRLGLNLERPKDEE